MAGSSGSRAGLAGRLMSRPGSPRRPKLVPGPISQRSASEYLSLRHERADCHSPWPSYWLKANAATTSADYPRLAASRRRKPLRRWRAASEPAGQVFWVYKMVLAAFEGGFGAAGAPNCLWRTEKACRGPTAAQPLESPARCPAPPSGCTKWFSPRSTAVLERWCTRLPRRTEKALECSPARWAEAASLRPASLSAASLVACPCVTKLTQLRTTSQSLTTMVVGYSLSFRPPPSSQTMTSSTRAP